LCDSGGDDHAGQSANISGHAWNAAVHKTAQTVNLVNFPSVQILSALA
jgi:hypothetical protein